MIGHYIKLGYEKLMPGLALVDIMLWPFICYWVILERYPTWVIILAIMITYFFIRNSIIFLTGKRKKKINYNIKKTTAYKLINPNKKVK